MLRIQNVFSSVWRGCNPRSAVNVRNSPRFGTFSIVSVFKKRFTTASRSEDGGPPRQSVRLAKLIADNGLCSRREAERRIRAGRVLVDGVTVKEPIAVSRTSTVCMDGATIKTRATTTKLWGVYKERGSLVSAKDTLNRDCIVPVVAKVLQVQHVIPVGRLDYNTEGLLLFTNDGELARMLELPSNSIERKYRVRIHGNFTESIANRMAAGPVIEGMKFRPVKLMGTGVRWDSQASAYHVKPYKSANRWIDFVLTEGKNREIRKLCEHFGLEVTRLIRIGYGPYSIDDIGRKEVVELDSTLIYSQSGPRPRKT